MPAATDTALQERRVSAPMIMRAAETRPSSYREEDNSVEVVWSTGARRTMFDWLEWDLVDEELSLEPGAVRLDRLNAGAAVLDTHSSYRLSSVIGSVEQGSARIDGDEAIARIRLADTDDVKDTVAKIRAGHIRNISVGYIIHAVTRFHKDGERTLLRVDDWEPTEISFVPVPADGGAQVGSHSSEQGGFPCIIRGGPAASRQENTMPQTNSGAPAGQTVEPTNTPLADAARQQQPTPEPTAPAPAASIVNSRRIRDVVSRSDLGSDFALELISRNEENPMSEGDLTDAIAAQLETRRNTAPIDSRITVGDPVASGEEFRSAVSNAILLRSDPRTEMSDAERSAATEFRGMSLLEIGRSYLEAHGIRTRGMDRMTLAGSALGMRAGMLTTSDFADALAASTNKRLRRAFEAAPQTFARWVSRGTLPDFKEVPVVGIGDAPELLLVLENGEFKRGALADFGDSYKLATYGRIIAITRQAIVNDDMRLFSRIPTMFGRKAADLESDLVYAQLTSNPTMYDGTALFHADHGNLAASGGPINESTLAAGKQAMRQQTSPEGGQLNIMPSFLIVGPAKEVEAQKMLTGVTATATGDVNVFANSLELVVESRITGNQWFLAADPDAYDTVTLDSLEGQEGVFTEQRVGFDVDGVETKARVDRVAKALDWRGLYKNAGN